MKCFTHSKEAIVPCTWCGKQLCEDCIAKQDGKKAYCEECVARLKLW